MRLIGCLLIVFISSMASAQLNTTNNWQAGAVYGPLFIGSIPGLTQLLPSTGFRLNKGMKYYRPEIGWISGDRSDQSFDLFTISMKNPIDLDSDELRPFFLVGLHHARYAHAAATGLTGNGFHLVAGVEYLIVGSAYLRGDMFYGNGPGRQLFVGVSLQFDIGSEKSEPTP